MSQPVDLENGIGPRPMPSPNEARRTTSAQVMHPWPLKVASGVLMLHGLLEQLPLLILIAPAIPHPSFAFVEVGGSWSALVVVGVVFGLLRWLAAGGVIAGRLWGWALGVVISAVTLSMLTLWLPFGAADASLSGVALAALIIGRYKKRRIINEQHGNRLTIS